MELKRLFHRVIDIELAAQQVSFETDYRTSDFAFNGHYILSKERLQNLIDRICEKQRENCSETAKRFHDCSLDGGLDFAVKNTPQPKLEDLI